jgi:hypothetical protein
MRPFALLTLGLVLAARVCAIEPDLSSSSYEQYRKILTSRMTPGLITVVGNDAPQAAVSLSASSSNGGTLFILRFGSVDNPKVIKYEYQDGHPIDGVKAIDALFAKAIEWKDVATAHNVIDLDKSLGSYNSRDYAFRITGDDSMDGIYMDPSAKTPSFNMLEIRQLHSIFSYLILLDNFQGGTHLLEASLQQARQDTDALFK